MYKKHSIEERLLAVKKCLEGYAPKAVGRQMGIEPNDVRVWFARYQAEGPIGLLKRPMKHADFAEKCKIVCEYAEKGVPLHKICAEYHIGRTAVQRWSAMYRQGGYDALRDIKPIGKGHLGMGRPKKKEPVTELEKLQRENELLRAENAYLKKLKALVTERERLAKKTNP